MKNKLLLLICVLLLPALVACGSDADTQTDGMDNTESETEGAAETKAETDTEKMTETETDVEDTADVPEYEIYTDSNGVYHVYSDHAELIYIKKASRFIVQEKISGKPLTFITDDALRDISDKANFRLFGESDSFARDYAIEHGCIFIEWYNGSLPNHYYPYNGDESVWVEAKDEYDYLYADDNHERISALVAQYLDSGEGYDELLELVLYQVACTAEFSCNLNDTFLQYYTREYQYESATVNDYDKYWVYQLDSNGNIDEFIMVRYGKLDTYEKIIANAELLYSPYATTNDITHFDRLEPRIIDVEGYAFQFPTGSGCSNDFSEAEYIMVVYDEAIYLTSSHRETDHGVDEGYTYECAELLLINGRWVFDSFYLPRGFEASDYKAHITSK